MRYTVTMTIYIDAENDKHAVSKAKMIAKREILRNDRTKVENEYNRKTFTQHN